MSITEAAVIAAFWDRDMEDMTFIIVPQGFTEIPANAFERCGWLTCVIILVTVKKIGDYAPR